MRTVVSRMWDENDGWADHAFLISPQDIDLHDSDTLTEIASINATLTNAISHDIAGNPPAVAENLDAAFGNDMASKTATLILVSSLATVQNSIRGLKDSEIVRNLCAPGINISEIQSKILPELKTNCWYLHIDNAGNFLFKSVQNVVAKLKSETKTIRVPEKTAGAANIDKSLPAIWKKRIKKESTAEVFEWMSLLKKHQVDLSQAALAINGVKWIAIETDAQLVFTHDQISRMLAFLQEVLAEGELKIEAGKLHYKTGQHLTDYVNDTREDFKIEDIEQ